MASDDGHWIEGLHKGGLREATHTPAGKDIPESTIEKDAHSKNPHLAKMARAAETLEHLRPGASHHAAGARHGEAHVGHVLNGPKR
jgi:hypothetical protein